MLKTIIFDCDGVMFQSKKANQNYYNALLEHFGHPPMDEDELEYVHIHNVTNSILHIFRHYPDTDFGNVHAYRQEISYHPFLKYMEIEPDLIHFLDTTQPDYNLAIATNRTDTMEPLLAEFSLDGYFTKVMTASNSRRSKPAPDPLLEIVDHFSCTIEESIFIGDSVIDEATASACGMRLIAYQNRGLKTNYHVNNFTQLLELLPKL